VVPVYKGGSRNVASNYRPISLTSQLCKVFETIVRDQVIEFLETNVHTHPFNGSFSGTTRESQYQKGKTNLDFTEATDSEWQWHQLDHMQVCISFQTNNHASTPPLSFLQAGCPSCRPTNSVKALKALETNVLIRNSQHVFRKGSSCLTNLLLFLDKVLHSVNDGFSVDVVFLDLAKAFDKVPHKRLLEKLKKTWYKRKALECNW